MYECLYLNMSYSLLMPFWECTRKGVVVRRRMQRYDTVGMKVIWGNTPGGNTSRNLHLEQNFLFW